MTIKLGTTDLESFPLGTGAINKAYVGSSKILPRRWTPADAANLAWFDAKDTATITEVSGDVSQWDDKSVYGRHISQSNGPDQPTFAADTVTFDGITQHLFNTTPFMFANGGINIFIVANLEGTLNDKRVVAEGSILCGTSIFGVAQSYGGGDASILSAFIRNDAGGVGTNSEELSLTGALDNTKKLYDWLDSGTSMAGSVNGSTPITVAYSRTGTMTVDRFAIGGLLRSTIISAMACGVNEIVITGVLSTFERQRMEGYMAWANGTEGDLVPGHPYENEPPRV